MAALGASVALTSSTATTSAPAFDPEPEVDATDESARLMLAEALGVEIHAFISQGFIKTSTNNYLASSARGSFELTEVGINFTKAVTDDLRGGIQFFARKLGPSGNYSPRFDWFYLDYHFRDWLGFRAGRVKLPFGLYNDTSDIDSARVPILLPQSVYPTANRDYLLAQTGGEIYGFVPLLGAGGLDYRLYGGTIYVPFTNDDASPARVDALETPYLVGGRVLWESPSGNFRGGGSVQALELSTDLTVGALQLHVDIPVVLWMLSLEYTRRDLTLAAEYGRWHLKAESSNPAIFPSRGFMASERFYLLGSYSVTDWLHAGVYYAVFFNDVKKREDAGRAGSQQDLALTLRFDINSFWLIKVEGHYLRGTAGLSSDLNDNKPLSELALNWFSFLLKTTLYY